MLQFECDQEAQSIYAMVEYPLEDSILTEKQLMRSLRSLVSLIDRFDQSIRLVLASGKIRLFEPKEEQVLQQFLHFMNTIDTQPETGDDDTDSDEEWI